MRKLRIVRVLLKNNPAMWLRRCHIATSVSVGSTHSIATSILNLYPYNIKIRHLLKWTDFDKRIKLAEWFLEDPIISRFFTPTHEAYFHLDGNVNNYNFSIFTFYVSIKSSQRDKYEYGISFDQWTIVTNNLSDGHSYLYTSIYFRTWDRLLW